MSTGPKGKWGGARPGSGPAPKVLDGELVARLVKRMDLRAVVHDGKTLCDLLLDIAYKENGFESVSDALRVKVIEVYFKYTMSTAGVTIAPKKDAEPPAKLPDMKADEGLVLKH